MQWADARMMRTLFIIKLDYGKYPVVSTYGNISHFVTMGTLLLCRNHSHVCVCLNNTEHNGGM